MGYMRLELFSPDASTCKSPAYGPFQHLLVPLSTHKPWQMHTLSLCTTLPRTCSLKGGLMPVDGCLPHRPSNPSNSQQRPNWHRHAHL